jgi:hypothetical protein
MAAQPTERVHVFHPSLGRYRAAQVAEDRGRLTKRFADMKCDTVIKEADEIESRERAEQMYAQMEARRKAEQVEYEKRRDQMVHEFIRQNSSGSQSKAPPT